MVPNGKKGRLAFPSPSEFPNLPTFGKWLPIACRDVVALTRYSDHYRDPCPREYIVPSSKGPYFFRNHPINYVMVTGKCVAFKATYYRDSDSYDYEYTLDDDTGGLLTVKEKSDERDENPDQSKIVGHYFQARGFVGMIYETKVVRARDIRILRKSVLSPGRSVFELFLDASAEVLRVRKELLCKSWQPKEIYNSQLTVEQDPELYASFSRAHSIFQKSQLFQKSIVDDYIPGSGHEEIIQVADTWNEAEQVKESVELAESEHEHSGGRRFVCKYNEELESIMVNIYEGTSLRIPLLSGKPIVVETDSRDSFVEDTQDSFLKDTEGTEEEGIVRIGSNTSIWFSKRGEIRMQDIEDYDPTYLEKYHVNDDDQEGHFDRLGKYDQSRSASKAGRKLDLFMQTILQVLPTSRRARKGKLLMTTTASPEKDARIRKRSSSPKMASKSIARQLPVSLECVGFEYIIRSKVELYHDSPVRNSFESGAERILPCGEVIAAGTEYLAGAMRRGVNNICPIIAHVEPLLSDLFNKSIVESVKHKRGWTPISRQIARDIIFFKQVYRYAYQKSPDLWHMLEDPGSILFEPIPSEAITKALKMGEDSAVMRGDLVIIDDKLVRATPELFAPLVRLAFIKPHGERHKRRTMDQVITQVRAKYKYAQPDMIAMAARKFVFDTGLTID